MQLLPFIKAFTKNPSRVSTIIPSFKALAKDMSIGSEISSRKNIVEVGVGTGALTAEILKRLTNDHSYIGFEIDASLFEYLNSSFLTSHKNEIENAGSFKILKESAENLSKYVDNGTADVVMSSLPWSVLPLELEIKLLDEIYLALKPGGLFTFYNYITTSKSSKIKEFKQEVENRFSILNSRKLVLKNIPPAHVWVAKK